MVVAGQTYPVRQCQPGFTQATDQRGRVQANVRHGLLHLTLDVPNDDQLLDWASTAHKPLSGHVTFFETNRQTARETVSFAAGQCMGYQETFVAPAARECVKQALVMSAAAKPAAAERPPPKQNPKQLP